MALTRFPKPGERVRFPATAYRKAELVITVDHVDSAGLVWCIYPSGEKHPFIGYFQSTASFNTEATIVEAEQ